MNNTIILVLWIGLMVGLMTVVALGLTEPMTALDRAFFQTLTLFAVAIANTLVKSKRR